MKELTGAFSTVECAISLEGRLVTAIQNQERPTHMNNITQAEYDDDYIVRLETPLYQLGVLPLPYDYDCGCVLVQGDDGEWYEDYDLNAYFD